MTIEARKIRLIMVLRRAGISDTAVLNAMERVPRERFIPQPFIDQSYENCPLPIGHGQTISQPQVVAQMTEALAVDKRCRVLEIGTGSGYQAAVLAKLCRRVYTIERIRPLLAEAEWRFRDLGLHNVTTRFGDGNKGWPEAAPFDRILVTAAAAGPEIPPALLDQLAVGGVLVAPIGDRTEQMVVRCRRTELRVEREELWPVRFVPLMSDAVSGTDPSGPAA